MGDRVLFVCHRGGDYISPAVYGHWIGHEALELLVAAAPTMRKDDSGYAAARLCGHLCAESPKDALGVGLHKAPENLEPATLQKFSHGDAGVVVIDVSSGKWECFGGYLAHDEELRVGCPNPLPLYEG